MHGVIIEGNCTVHNGLSYIVMVRIMGRLFTHNTRNIQKTPIMAEHCLREQTVKGTGYLEGIFTDTKSSEHNRSSNLIQQEHY